MKMAPNHNRPTLGSLEDDMPDPEEHPDAQTFDSIEELSELEGFENADRCPDCDAPRPFGAACPKCGSPVEETADYEYQRSSGDKATLRASSTPGATDGSSENSDTPVTSSEKALDRVVVVVVHAESDSVALSKAKVALERRSTDLEDPAPTLADFDLIAHLDGGNNLLAHKWGRLPDAVALDTAQGQSLVETGTEHAVFSADKDTVSAPPTFYDELGNGIRDQLTLDRVLSGEESLVTVNEDDSTYLVPALSYKYVVAASTASDGGGFSSDTEPENPFEKYPDVETLEQENFEDTMERLAEEGRLPQQ